MARAARLLLKLLQERSQARRARPRPRQGQCGTSRSRW